MEGIESFYVERGDDGVWITGTKYWCLRLGLMYGNENLLACATGG
jgi:hypothetical protein